MDEVLYFDLIYFKMFNEFFVCELKVGVCFIVEGEKVIIYFVDVCVS